MKFRILRWLVRVSRAFSAFFAPRQTYRIKAEYHHPFDTCLDHKFTVQIVACTLAEAKRLFWAQERKAHSDVTNIHILSIFHTPHTN